MPARKKHDIGQLYRELRNLGDTLASGVDTGELAQEILDFLAMAAGLKPVLLLGRGLDLPQWVAGAADFAEDVGYNVIPGPYWDATPFGRFPDWYRDHTASQLSPCQAVYICRSDDTAQAIGSINDAGGHLSMSAEARLLGYPVCCVVAHYDRAVRYHQATFSILKRLADDEPVRMQALLRGGAALTPGTPTEIAHMEAAFDLQPAPFGSWNRCPRCAREDDSQSADLSRRYQSLAETADPEWLRNFD